MNKSVIPNVTPECQAAIDRLLTEVHGAVGSFVAHCMNQDNVRQDRVADTGTPVHGIAGIAVEVASVDLYALLRGQHLRAGRALIDWSMSDLANACGLSLSTIRRLEQDAEGVLTRNRRSAAEALQAAGISFLRLSNGTVAVVESANAVA